MKQVESSESQRKVCTAAEEEEEIQVSTLKPVIKSLFSKLDYLNGRAQPLPPPARRVCPHAIPVPIKPTVVLQPNWSQIFRGENITLRCEIQGGGGTQWMYEWRPTNRNPPSFSEFRIIRAASGRYSCRGTGNYLSYSFELLPNITSRTEQNSYIVHEQTHTAGYVCRAGRGKPVDYTGYSEPKFVWSADLHPAASLSVSPDRVQHFRSDSVSLSCEGKSAEWRVWRFTGTDPLSDCSIWGNMNRSTCTINPYWFHSGVYWCESGSGEFSNAVNITIQSRL
ncbi:hypothetical protein XENORESO_000475 [Xenotaenia resolanae]|uniref:Ig-like domain-containing protein n=1 Tax=Xenotaenia resolanae TaxID=208358 RepID=A0ABV0W0L9_9TELE